jgi:hypothetical protein
LKLGSVKAFEILNLEADRAKIGFDSIDYHLRCREFSSEPIWTLVANDAEGNQVARVDLSGESGRVMRTVWTYRVGRKVPVIRDSVLLGLLDPIEGRAAVRRIDDTEPIGPAQRTKPGVPEPIEDPTPINDPGTEVPEVVPIDPEELPVVDEP